MLKRQRELQKAEKAAAKRQARFARRHDDREGAPVETEDGVPDEPSAEQPADTH